MSSIWVTRNSEANDTISTQKVTSVKVSHHQHNVYSRPPCLLGNVRTNNSGSTWRFVGSAVSPHQSCSHPADFPRVVCLLFLDSLLVAVCSFCLFVCLVFESILAQTQPQKTLADRMHVSKSVRWLIRQTGHGVTNSVCVMDTPGLFHRGCFWCSI